MKLYTQSSYSKENLKAWSSWSRSWPECIMKAIALAAKPIHQLLPCGCRGANKDSVMGLLKMTYDTKNHIYYHKWNIDCSLRHFLHIYLMIFSWCLFLRNFCLSYKSMCFWHHLHLGNFRGYSWPHKTQLTDQWLPYILGSRGRDRW